MPSFFKSLTLHAIVGCERTPGYYHRSQGMGVSGIFTKKRDMLAGLKKALASCHGPMSHAPMTQAFCSFLFI
uniref:Uncharacterized protein n=1 Tax=Arundo donax TaxID=35708 RepID=A0A0A9HVY2_ARUDO